MPGCHVERPRTSVVKYLRRVGREDPPPADPPGLEGASRRLTAAAILNPKSEFKCGAARGPDSPPMPAPCAHPLPAPIRSGVKHDNEDEASLVAPCL